MNEAITRKIESARRLAGLSLRKLSEKLDGPHPAPTAPPPITHAGRRPARLEVDAFATSGVVLDTIVPMVGIHPYPLSELMLMAAAFYDLRPQRVIDVGTHHGKSARIWHELGKTISAPPAIHTIDLLDPTHPEFPGEKHGQYCRNLSNVTLHSGDGAATAARLIADEPDVPTLVFLDGDHACETVARELGVCQRLTAASILLHDTLWQPGSSYNQGPFEAITDFLAAHPDVEYHHTHLGLPGMTLLRIPGSASAELP